MSGLIGSAVRARLAPNYTLSALNRRPIPGIQTVQADIADLEAIKPAFQNQDVVVHLAGYRGYDWNSLLHTNIVGTYNVFEASREAGVKRIIYASSGAPIAGGQRIEPYKTIVEGRYEQAAATWPMLDHNTLPRPTGIYGCTKVWGEALAWDYTQAFDLSILCLRFGPVTPEDRPTKLESVPAWCSQRDAAQLVERCIQAPAALKFDIFNGISNNKWRVRDISHARDVVGYEPQDSAEDHPL